MQQDFVYSEHGDVEDQLSQLSIPRAALVRAAQAGFVQRSYSLPSDPVTAAGTDAWRYAVRSLRTELQYLGWRLDNPQNLPLVISDELKINVTVSSGDEATGIPFRMPRTKNPKGSLLEAAVARNVRQLHLFPGMLTDAEQKFDKTLDYPTWVFLVFITDEEIRAELSLPNSFGENDRLDGWAKRIIIDIPLPDEELSTDSDDDFGPEITPVVTSKI